MSAGLKIIKIVAWILVGVTLLFFAAAEFWPRAQTIVIDPRRDTRLTTSLGPPARVDLSSAPTLIIGEPVYFDALLPAPANRVRVEIALRPLDGLPLPKIGAVLDENTFRLYDLTASGMANGFILAEAELDLRDVPRHDGGVRFIISAPGVAKEKPITIQSIRLTSDTLKN